MANIVGYLLCNLIFVLIPLLFGIISVKDYYTCNIPVKAKYLDYSKMYFKPGYLYSLKFEYEYNDLNYVSETRNPVSKTILDKFIKDKNYIIYINKKNPLILNVSINPMDLVSGIILIITGITFFIFLLIILIMQ